MRHKIILDCDPGHDDAVALLLAARHPAIDLLAVTTVAGNQSVDKTTCNALKVLSLANLCHIPVAMGMDRPLVRPARYAPEIHGASGLDGPLTPEPVCKPVATHAVDLLIECLLNSEGDLTLVATGPLTNIATAMRKQPAIVPKIKAISLMGGAIGLGNVTPKAEFNIYTDPEAAEIVFTCGRPLTVSPLEVTHQALATAEVVARLRAANRRVATFVADLLVFFAETYRTVFGFAAPPLHDPCAVAAVIDPDMLIAQPMHVAIETGGTWTTGSTVCDVHHVLNLPPNARVGSGLQVERFWELVLGTILSYEDQG
jgi:inosine-uridine nucleoside N-ribohydrolase